MSRESASISNDTAAMAAGVRAVVEPFNDRFDDLHRGLRRVVVEDEDNYPRVISRMLIALLLDLHGSGGPENLGGAFQGQGNMASLIPHPECEVGKALFFWDDHDASMWRSTAFRLMRHLAFEWSKVSMSPFCGSWPSEWVISVRNLAGVPSLVLFDSRWNDLAILSISPTMNAGFTEPVKVKWPLQSLIRRGFLAAHEVIEPQTRVAGFAGFDIGHDAYTKQCWAEAAEASWSL